MPRDVSFREVLRRTRQGCKLLWFYVRKMAPVKIK